MKLSILENIMNNIINYLNVGSIINYSSFEPDYFINLCWDFDNYSWKKIRFL